MIDDIGRNFLMNPQNGLKVPPALNPSRSGLLPLLPGLVESRDCVSDPTLYEGSPQQREGQGAVQTGSVPQRNRQAR